MFSSYCDESILRRAQQKGLIAIHLHDFRTFATDKHRTTDEPPFGGGGGMVLKPEPIFACVEQLLEQEPTPNTPIILLTPQGRVFDQKIALELAQHPRLIFICGRYEGVDERIRQHLVTDELSIGDYVLTGGELAAMVVIDAVSRLQPGVLGDDEGAMNDSHASGLLEGPHYTKPAVFRGWAVPDLLRSGNTKGIEKWRREQALRRTWQRRPTMLLSTELLVDDSYYLASLAREQKVNLEQKSD